MWIKNVITFNNLADAFIQTDLQMRGAIEAVKQTIGQQYANVLWVPLVERRTRQVAICLVAVAFFCCFNVKTRLMKVFFFFVDVIFVLLTLTNYTIITNLNYLTHNNVDIQTEIFIRWQQQNIALQIKLQLD